MLEFLSDVCRYCPCCGKSWGIFHWLCPRCEIDFMSQLQLRHRKINRRIDHYYLFDWKPTDHLRPIVHSLKGGGHGVSVKKLVTFFPTPHREPPVFYVKGQHQDHGWTMANAVSSVYGGEIQGLVKRGWKKQALLSRRERKRRHFEPLENPPKQALFVDDIVTTGSTFLAAFQALGQPTKLTVWSLFYRNRL